MRFTGVLSLFSNGHIEVHTIVEGGVRKIPWAFGEVLFKGGLI